MEIFSIELLDEWLGLQPRPPALMVGLDLTARSVELQTADFAGSAVHGCTINPTLFQQLVAQGGSLILSQPDLPFDPFRHTLYSTQDLYDRYDAADSLETWKQSFDYRCYRWFMDEADQVPRILTTSQAMQARLHDTAVEGAVARFVADSGRPLVGFMGGHDTPRDTVVYKTVAGLARRLTRSGLMVLTGGGPGLMEAANLGAFLAPYDDDVLDRVCAELAQAPRYDHPDWLSTAWRVKAVLLSAQSPHPSSVSLGIPTWLYGFEPPNVFATHQAKMFYNSLREDGLVTLAGAGLVIGPGNAGTVQEVFQDATQNYYRKAGVAPTPIALLGESFWSRPAAAGPDTMGRAKPLRPLLMALAGEKPKSDWTSAVLITDDVDAIAALLLKAHAPGRKTRGEIWRDCQSSLALDRATRSNP
ncbi:hypothetical protein MMB232_00729 [Brevundimonas subvibrioides]|uniref:LOG family protein n=1 Tax=Brevundimonas subvibrioides TaxID=74313 RepID=UPI0032D58354